MIRSILTLLTASIFLFNTGYAQNRPAGQIKLLVFSKTDGYRHASIPVGVRALREISEENGFLMDHTENANLFNPSNLKQYDTVVFLNTTEDVLNEAEQNAFQAYIRNGGGYVGIHAASDTEFDWPWYGRLVGAYFDGHPKIQRAIIRVKDKTHPSTKHLPDAWNCTDEWYNFRDIQPDINVLAELDESSYQGGENGSYHPISWYHEFEGGRAFYTGRGHTDESYSEPMFRQHILGGIRYAAGK